MKTISIVAALAALGMASQANALDLSVYGSHNRKAEVNNTIGVKAGQNLPLLRAAGYVERNTSMRQTRVGFEAGPRFKVPVAPVYVFPHAGAVYMINSGQKYDKSGWAPVVGVEGEVKFSKQHSITADYSYQHRGNSPYSGSRISVGYRFTF